MQPQVYTYVRSLIGTGFGLFAGILPLAQAEENSATFSITGETRVRYEALDGQFRSGGEGGDQLLLFRSLVHGAYDMGKVRLGLELQDSRTYLADDGTPLSSSIANPLDILQAYVAFDAPGFLGEGSTSTVKLGRQTVSIGSKRQIERVSYANVIKSYTGVHWDTRSSRGDELHFIYLSPIARHPATRPALDDNELSGDEEQWGRRIWGVHYRRNDIAPSVLSNVWGEVFAYGLNEDDRTDVQTSDRDYVMLGGRFHRKKRAGQLDFDVEGVWRTGSRSPSSNPADENSLEVNAGMLYARTGYTFDAPWTPRLALEYYLASGDEDPTDDSYERYDRLFGSRRTDLNNTSIHGPLTPSNLNAIGVRFEFKRDDRFHGWFSFRKANLESETDSWVIARQRDPSGQSGDDIGNTVDGRVVYWLMPEELELELGASFLFKGDFAKNAPNSGDDDDTRFGYMSLRYVF